MKLTKYLIWIFGLIVLSSLVTSLELDDGLVSWWKFTNDGNDSFGRNNFTNFNQVTRQASGGADGAYYNRTTTSDGTFGIGSGLVGFLNTSWAIKIHFFIDSDTGARQALITGEADKFIGFEWDSSSACAANQLSLMIGDGSDWIISDGEICGPTVDPTGGWHESVIMYNGSNYFIYYDGALHTNNTSMIGVGGMDGLNFLVWGTGVNFETQGGIDEIGLWNRSLTDAEIITLNTSFYPFADSDPPVIDDTTWNVTSGYGNTTAWRSDKAVTVRTTDSTPSITFSVDESSNCSISLVDGNFTNMTTDDANTKCGTTDATDHTCTAPASQALSESYQDIFVACTDGINENVTSSSGALNISLDYSFTGTVKDADGNSINGATVVILYHSNNTVYTSVQSNSTADFVGYTPTEENYTVYAFDANNTSLQPDIDTFIVVP